MHLRSDVGLSSQWPIYVVFNDLARHVVATRRVLQELEGVVGSRLEGTATKRGLS